MSGIVRGTFILPNPSKGPVAAARAQRRLAGAMEEPRNRIWTAAVETSIDSDDQLSQAGLGLKCSAEPLLLICGPALRWD